eukprot:237233-Pelagomonas_calceolata.AAC.1
MSRASPVSKASSTIRNRIATHSAEHRLHSELHTLGMEDEQGVVTSACVRPAGHRGCQAKTCIQ